jgi:hypothetical protein
VTARVSSVEMTTHASVRTTEPRTAPPGDYQPGVCNIGPVEIRRRRMAGHAGLVAAVALLAILVAAGAPPLMRLAVLVPAAVSASGYMQARMRFCAAYGSAGIFNFGGAGDAMSVADAEARAADRRRALRIGAASAASGAVVAVLAVLLPI